MKKYQIWMPLAWVLLCGSALSLPNCESWIMTQNLSGWEQKTHAKLKPRIDKIEIWKCFYVVIFDFELWHPTVRIIGGERHPPLNSRFSLRHKTAFFKELLRWLLILPFYSHFVKKYLILLCPGPFQSMKSQKHLKFQIQELPDL